jgi:hypothetical protein
MLIGYLRSELPVYLTRLDLDERIASEVPRRRDGAASVMTVRAPRRAPSRRRPDRLR